MSEMSTESTSSRPAAGSSSSSPFLRKLGPLPVWAWMGVLLGLLLAFYYFRQNKAAQANNTSTDSGSATSGTPNSQIPQFVNQVYTNQAPPVTTGPTQTNTPVPPPPTLGGTPGSPIFVDNVAGSLPMPTNLSVKPGTTNATINWNPISGATLYHVQVENAKGQLIYDNKSVSGNSVIADKLAANTKGYKYRVSAIAPQPGEWTAWSTFNTAK